jgi:hypothetical protein
VTYLGRDLLVGTGIVVLLNAGAATAQPPEQPADAQSAKKVVKVPEEPVRRQVVPFLDGTYVFVDLPKDDIRFEADIQPNFVIRQTFSDQLNTDTVLDERKVVKAFSIVGTPRVRLRMFDARSAPVRTPSYMPKGSFTAIFLRGVRKSKRDPEPHIGLWGIQGTVGHHSNGQDGCLFTTDQLVDGACVGTPDLSKINKVDGSFSTNFVRIGGRYRREWLRDITPADQKKLCDDPAKSDQCFEEQIGVREYTVGFDVQQHFHTDPRVKPFYGTTRFELSFSGAMRFKHVCRSRARTTATLYYVGEPPDGVGPLAFQGEGACTFTDQGGWGVFLRFYAGQDYYNLGFADSIARFMVGAHFEQDGFLRFLSRRAREAMKEEKKRREDMR